MARGGFRRSRWAAYQWDRQTRRIDFYERHAKLRPVPYLILATLVVVLAISIGISTANPAAKLYGYALSLVIVDVGMVVIAGLFVFAGRLIWREDRDSTYLALALGFSGVPVWGLLEVLCVNGTVMSAIPGICDIRPSAGWIVGVWFVAVPAASVLLGFRTFLRRKAAAPRTP